MPVWTDAFRDEFAADLGFAMGLGGDAYALEQFLHPQNGYILARFYDDTARTTFGRTFKFTAGKIGLDTDSEGLVYVKVTDNSGGAGNVKLDF